MKITWHGLNIKHFNQRIRQTTNKGGNIMNKKKDKKKEKNGTRNK